MMSLSNDYSSEVEEIVSELLNKKEEEKKIAAERDGKIAWRIANALMTLFFLMAAGVQFNDPDPFLWVPLYGSAALLTLSIVIWPNSSGDRKWHLIFVLFSMWCAGMFLYVIVEFVSAILNPSSDGSLNPLTYEEGREMAGVMITAIWIFICKQSPTVRCNFPSWCQFCKSRKINQNTEFEIRVMKESDVA